MIPFSLSPYIGCFAMVKQNNGELKLCFDFHPFNELIIKDVYPLPRTNESLSRLGKAKIYTSIGLEWTFQQIPVSKAGMRKNASA